MTNSNSNMQGNFPANHSAHSLSWDMLRLVLQRPVAFFPVFGKIAGSAKAGLFLSQAFYWHDKGNDSDWFYKTQKEWEDETCLSHDEQLTARRELVRRGFLKEKKMGMPAKIYFSLDKDAILSALSAYERGEYEAPAPAYGETVTLFTGKPDTRLRESRKHASAKAVSMPTEKPEALIGAEITSENTQENTSIKDDFSTSFSDSRQNKVTPNPAHIEMLIGHRFSYSESVRLVTEFSERCAQVPEWWASVDKTRIKSDVAAIRSFIDGTGKWVGWGSVPKASQSPKPKAAPPPPAPESNSIDVHENAHRCHAVFISLSPDEQNGLREIARHKVAPIFWDRLEVPDSPMSLNLWELVAQRYPEEVNNERNTE